MGFFVCAGQVPVDSGMTPVGGWQKGQALYFQSITYCIVTFVPPEKPALPHVDPSW